MNFIYALIDYTDFWKTEYICFSCGRPFKMYKSVEDDNNIKCIPVCRYSCGIPLLSGEKSLEINKYQETYGKDWKKYYLEKIEKEWIEKERLHREKIEKEWIEKEKIIADKNEKDISKID